MYFCNGDLGIGVVTANNPTGPFKDPIGKELISMNTPGVMPAQNMWLFDPMTFIDDDGQAYMYFGGNGESNVRVIKLNEDMISIYGRASSFHVPSFFEASWMHKRNGIYYFSYSTNPRAQMRIDYMTSKSPTTGFTYGGIVAAQPPNNNNNGGGGYNNYNGGGGNNLACYVADMSPTCRRHVSMSPNLGRHCVSLRHRRVPDTPNLYQLQPTITNQPKRTGILATIEFLCLSSNNNHEITDMSGIPRHVVKCRVVLDTLPTRHFLVSATWPATCRDMSPTRHRMSPFGQQKRHADIRHNGLRILSSPAKQGESRDVTFPRHTHVPLSLGGPPPGFPQKEHFLCGTSSEKASREGPNIQRKTARRFPRIGDGTLTPLSWRTTPSIRITSPSTWESVHVSTLPRDAY